MTKTSRNARCELLKRLRYELVGPSSEKEQISVSPLQKYLAGIVWPMNSNIASAEDENELVHGKKTAKESIESIAPLAKAMNPSAIGMSFLIDKKNPVVDIEVKFGMYEEKAENEETGSEWLRIPYELKRDNPIDFRNGMGSKQKIRIPHPNGDKGNKESINVEWLVREYQNNLAVSLFLVNRYEQDVDENKIDYKCVFQPEIKLKSVHTEAFLERNAFSNNENVYRDEDTRTNDLLYRNDYVFAVGHSISVNWDNVNSNRAGELYTQVIPSHEIPMVLSQEWSKGGTLDMKKLGGMKSAVEVQKALNPLLQEYKKWIEERRGEIPELEKRYRETAEMHIERCEKSLTRMQNGLNIIGSNKKVLNAFLFANRIMAQQRINSVIAESQQPENEIEAKWRSFQVAFFLQNIEGVVDPKSPDRNIADLLWFPTGGGKTEAYLGIAAFSLGYRRMSNVDGFRTDVGVSVIMRYTLRLLTVQQFQRAAAMICACEEERDKNPELLGITPFRIGLWVGQKSTPNNFDDANEIITSNRTDAMSGKMFTPTDPSIGTPVQLVSCPKCGTKLVNDKNPRVFMKTYFANKNKRRVIIKCPDKKCSFHKKEGIPVVVTDEEIYRLLPDMIIGTVDKFARMPWQPQIQNLFGNVSGEVEDWGFISNDKGQGRAEIKNVKKVCGNASIKNDSVVHPPNLIIQDELHLISGPLGTMVGLYETAVDYLCSIQMGEKRIGPKVIASTATIKNANHQIQGLFTREAQIFPSPGLTQKDSFFAKEQPLDKKAGRMYVGLFAPGKSMKTVLLRAYANLLASVTKMEGKHSSEALDPYQTLVGYFNSLRELGGAVRLIEDDVPARMRTLESQYSEEDDYQFSLRDYDRDVPELTSRIDSSQIPRLLDRLNQHYYEDGEIEPVDVLLASNMISVGVDVPRLGLMVVNGQPKTTAEYIQSTSRVGRTMPGLILTAYNWARPRDISHYEEFFAYHESIYRYVEPISVTPFASRARDRGLAGVMVSIERLGNRDLTSNQSARKFEYLTGEGQKVVEIFIERAREMRLSTIEIEKHIDQLINNWEVDAQKSQLVYYSGGKKDKESNLLYPLGKKKGGTFKTPNSLRDVETATGIYLKGD